MAYTLRILAVTQHTSYTCNSYSNHRKCVCARATIQQALQSTHTQRVHVLPLQHFTCSHLLFALFIFLLVLSCFALHIDACVVMLIVVYVCVMHVCVRAPLFGFGSAYFCFRSLIFTAILSLCCVLSCVINGFGSGIAANKWHKQQQQHWQRQKWIPKRNNVNGNLLSIESVDTTQSECERASVRAFALVLILMHISK